MNITVYGDSILKGVLLEDRRYVVNREWEQRFAEQFGCTVTNRSRIGCTIRKALAVIRHDCAGQRSLGLTVLELGGNDCDFDWAAVAADPDGEYQAKTPADEFLEDYREAIGLVRDSGAVPIVLTLPPIHSERYLRFICRGGLDRDNIVRWLGDVEHISRWQEDYSEMAREAARAEGVRCVDLRSAFPREPGTLAKYLCEDGIHPSRLGQRLIFHALALDACRAYT